MGLLTRWAARVERVFGAYGRSTDMDDDLLWSAGLDFTEATASGARINQQTSLNVTAVLACVAMLAEDVAKLTPAIYRTKPNGGREKVKDHPVAKLLRKPNDWQSGLEFREMMQISLVLRGNAYALIVRDQLHRPVKLVPINADRVAMWEAPDGALYYRVTPVGLHEMAQFQGQPFLIPAEDMLHIRGFSLNGLLGASRIRLAKEAIGLALGYERQASNLMGNGGRPSGVLQTEKQLTRDAAKRIGEDWKSLHGGLLNSGRIAVLEQGLKFSPITLSAADLEFIASRKFQLEEISRIFRVPLHKIGSLDRSTNNNIAQQSQDYINETLTGYTARWTEKYDVTFGLEEQGLSMAWDYSILTRADQASRYTAYRTGVMSMFLTPDEARIDDGRDPMGGEAAELQKPSNMAAPGSQSSGTKADGGGRPDGAVDGSEGIGAI